MDSSELRLPDLIDLHNNIWTDELIRGKFRYIFDRVLTPTERVITELKIDEMDEDEICKLIQIKPKSLLRRIYIIKSKYRNQIDTRVDNKTNEFSLKIFKRKQKWRKFRRDGRRPKH